MLFRLTDAERSLCAALSASAADPCRSALDFVQDLGEEAAFRFAERNDVVGHVAHATRPASRGNQLPPRWDEMHDATQQRVQRYLVELSQVAQSFAEIDIPLVALKNTGIALGLNHCAGCCPMGDVDVMVRRQDFRQAHNRLLELGYHFKFRSLLEEDSLESAEADGSAEYWKPLDDGHKLWFELQWRPVAGRWIQPDQEPNADDLMARSLPVEGSCARILSPEDNLLQVALHTAKHSYVRAPGFRLHTDVDRIVNGQSVDWDTFLRLVRKFHVKTAVHYSLVIPRELFGTPIPDDVCRQLQPANWKTRRLHQVLRKAGLFHPDERKFGTIDYLAFATLLYDDLRGLRAAVFPQRELMRQRYGDHHPLVLPVLHLRRIWNLLFRRLPT